jgi:hypothetical protein
VNQIRRLELIEYYLDDPCRLVRPVKQILGLLPAIR